MARLGLAPNVMKPTALRLNIFVAALPGSQELAEPAQAPISLRRQTNLQHGFHGQHLPWLLPSSRGSSPGMAAAPGVGQSSMPITPLGGSLLHADSQHCWSIATCGASASPTARGRICCATPSPLMPCGQSPTYARSRSYSSTPASPPPSATPTWTPMISASRWRGCRGIDSRVW